MGRVTTFSDFIGDLELRNISRLQPYICYVGEFCRTMEQRGKDPEKADRNDLRAYLQVLRGRKLKLASQTKAFSCISQYYTYLVDEELIAANPVNPFRKRYLRRYKEDSDTDPRQLISIDQAAMLVNSILSSTKNTLLKTMTKTTPR